MRIFFYLVHSHDNRGLSFQGGTPALLKFQDITEAEKYIQVNYLEYRDFQQTYLYVQFVQPRVKCLGSLKSI